MTCPAIYRNRTPIFNGCSNMHPFMFLRETFFNKNHVCIKPPKASRAPCVVETSGGTDVVIMTVVNANLQKQVSKSYRVETCGGYT